jgi:hypothetical protein
MSFRFGSWPTFNGKKVVLEDDVRLAGGTPTSVAGDATYTAPADAQVLAFVPLRVDGTLVVNGTMVML